MRSKIYQPIINALKAKSEAGELHWIQTQAENEFLLGLSNYSLSIRMEYEKAREQTVIILSLFDSHGAKIDSLLINAANPYWAALESIYLSARINIQGVDTALTEILNELKGEGNVGKPLPKP